MYPKLKHEAVGTVSFACQVVNGVPMAASQFFITLGQDLDYLDGKQGAVFGKVVEGLEVLDKFNQIIVDNHARPYRDVRILHTIVLDDPFPDPDGLRVPEASPEPSDEIVKSLKLATEQDATDPIPPEELERIKKAREAEARALTLEMVGDLPFADIKPPENILFVCKLNPVTRDEDLELIFSRFGQINSCEIIKDKRTGDSLGYAFIEFENKEDCEEAYLKMENVLIDDRRIHEDFSQSVSKLSKDWMNGRRDRMGFAGRSDLQKKSRYRGRQDRDRGEDYEMLFHDSRRKSRSPDERRDTERRRSPDRRRDTEQRRRSPDGRRETEQRRRSPDRRRQSPDGRYRR
jgi:peptidyl-prolyl cis-trans isomerase-like 4